MAVIEGQSSRYLSGNYGPVSEEITRFDLPVTGEVPAGLDGRYLRIGPNPWPLPEGPYHWFTGAGMVHGVELRDGRAASYRNRWVRTDAQAERLGEPARGGPAQPMFDSSNTNVLAHAGRILAMTEGCLPYELTPELDTVGRTDFGGPLPAGFTAHPKVDPGTGELLGFSYGFAAPWIRYHVIGPDGRLVRSIDIETPGAPMMHDFVVTDRSVVFFDLPVLFRLELALDPSVPFPFTWDDDYGARIGVMARDGDGSDLRWFDVDPCYVFHPMNAYEDGDQLVIDVVRYPDMFRPREADVELLSRQTLDRWTVDRAAGKVREERIHDRPQEFPRIDPRRAGLRHRYGYAAAGTGPDDASAVLKHDLVRGTVEAHDFGPGRVPGEATFVPAPDGRAEDEGWLLTLVYDGPSDASELVVLDATDVAAAPLARVHLPQRVPFGFHGNWVADA
jgi:carotenoid cleavage dioxygenase